MFSDTKSKDWYPGFHYSYDILLTKWAHCRSEKASPTLAESPKPRRAAANTAREELARCGREGVTGSALPPLHWAPLQGQQPYSHARQQAGQDVATESPPTPQLTAWNFQAAAQGRETPTGPRVSLRQGGDFRGPRQWPRAGQRAPGRATRESPGDVRGSSWSRRNQLSPNNEMCPGTKGKNIQYPTG